MMFAGSCSALAFFRRLRYPPAMHTIKSGLDNATSNTAISPEAGSSRTGWDFFDRVYCISLVNREDRRQEAIRQFAGVGLAGKVEFVIVEKHPTDCEQGIYESHLHCMAKGLADGAEHILIFEDDIIFDRFSPEAVDEIVSFLKRDPDWQIFFLGCMVKKSLRTAYPAILRIGYRSLTHAYAIPRRFAQEMVESHPWHDVAFDDFLRDLDSPRMYAAYPSFAFQSDAASDNDVYLPLDRFRRLMGGLRSIQKRNELYHHYKQLIIGCHILILAALIYWLKG